MKIEERQLCGEAYRSFKNFGHYIVYVLVLFSLMINEVVLLLTI
jgi:hypothetical protein